MIELSIAEAVILFIALIVAIAAVALYLPPWAAFLMELSIVIYTLGQAIVDEWTLWRVVRIVFFSALAGLIWWRYLRGTEDRYGRRRKRRADPKDGGP
jgi:hypothetical protein